MCSEPSGVPPPSVHLSLRNDGFREAPLRFIQAFQLN